MIDLRDGPMEADFSTRGAELRALRWRGLDLLWDGDPAWWGRRAPLLFPIVGRLNGDTLRAGGRHYALPQHGFARDLPWTLLDRGAQACRMALRDDAWTRERFPFAFDLEQRASLDSGSLQLAWTLRNPGPGALTASLGAHPAFRWPLPGGERGRHELRFECAEPEGPRRLSQGALRGDREASPLPAGRLALDDDLFIDDALVFDRLRSRRLRYTAPGAPVLELAWDFPHFGLWTKPGAPFLCLEPWQGHADPEGFDGEFAEKPGTVTLGEGESRSWTLSIRVSEALP